MAVTTEQARIEIGASSEGAVKQVREATSALKSFQQQTKQKSGNPFKDVTNDPVKLSRELNSIESQIRRTYKSINTAKNEMS